LNEDIITLEVHITKILNIHKFEPKKKYIEELEDTDATSIDEDTDEEEDDEHHTEDEEDDEEESAIKNDEILRVEEIIQEEVAVAVVNDGKVACDVCGLRFTSRGLNRHKFVHIKK